MPDKSADKLSIFQVVMSVIASFFGVQSDAKRERDFARGRVGQFVFVGILLTLIFIIFVWLMVQFAMQAVAT